MHERHYEIAKQDHMQEYQLSLIFGTFARGNLFSCFARAVFNLREILSR